MIVITASKVKRLLTVENCIEVMIKALLHLYRGEAVQELRSVFTLEQGKLLGQMPGYLKREGVIGTKVITVFHKNSVHGLPSHQGVVLWPYSHDPA